MNQKSVEGPLDERIKVITSSDYMVGYIRLDKTEPDEEQEPIKSEEIFNALKDKGIVFGIKEDMIEKFAERPIFGIKIELARGKEPIDGQDGYVNFYVKRDSEYQPDYDDEGIIDYKNLDYFQLVKKGHLLCEIVHETEGLNGMNIFGGEVLAKSGRPPVSPVGKNTELSEDGKKLFATVDGLVKFTKDYIDISDVLQIRSDVDQTTGNIDFSGDVIVSGDVSYGFSLKSGGNVTVRGFVEGAKIEAAGDIHISKGINGAGGEKVIAGGDLRSGYIENADIEVEGNIVTDYIIDSNVLCKGNIELSGRNELVIGGSIKLYGDLIAKNIGNENERPTRIELLGTVKGDTLPIKTKEQERASLKESADKILVILRQYSRFGDFNDDELDPDKLAVLKQQYQLINKKIAELNVEIKQLRKEISREYVGSIICKRKLYQGVKIYFGGDLFYFNLDNLEHCRIFCIGGKISHGSI